MNEEQIRLLVETNERSKSNSHRIDKIEKDYELLHEMNTNIQLIAQQNVTTKDDMEEMKRDISIVKTEVTDVKTEVADVKSAPLRQEGETYKNMKWFVLSAIVGYLLSYVLTQIIK